MIIEVGKTYKTSDGRDAYIECKLHKLRKGYEEFPYIAYDNSGICLAHYNEHGQCSERSYIDVTKSYDLVPNLVKKKMYVFILTSGAASVARASTKEELLKNCRAYPGCPVAEVTWEVEE